MFDRGNGPAIVVIPGVQGRWEWMRPALEALSARCRTLSYSLCGDFGSHVAMLYRTTGLVDERLQDGHDAASLLAALEELAIESSILKVAASETLDFVLDENVQIHGGNGFVRDYPAERHYRDARVNRIFEGTNEINRLLIPGMLVRRALKGGPPIIAAAKGLMDELMAPPSLDQGSDAPLEAEQRVVAAMKKTGLMVIGTALQTYGDQLTDQQEVLMAAADILIDAYASESAVARARQSGTPATPDALHLAAARVFVNDAADRVEHSARTALAGMAEGDTLRTLLAALRRLLKVAPANAIALRRQLADATVGRKSYMF